MKRFRRLFALAAIVIFAAVLLAGPIQKTRRPVSNRFEHLLRVSVGKSGRSRAVNEDFLVTYTDPHTIALFEETLVEATAEELNNPIADADYDILLTFKDGKYEDEWVKLYLGNIGQPSAFVYHADEELAYFTSLDRTGELWELFSSFED